MNIKNKLNSLSITPNKALGQNFLTDEQAIKKIVSVSDVRDFGVLEIGPGLGALTSELMKVSKKVVAVEIDVKMIDALNDLKNESEFGEKLILVHDDILKTDFAFITKELSFDFSQQYKVVGNLPYYITTPICVRLMKQHEHICQLTLMMQREAATRITAKPKSEQYGPLSIVSQYIYDTQSALELSPQAYYPQPDVFSTVITMKKRDYDIKKANMLIKITNICFAMRRKTIQNNLSNGCGKEKSQKLLSVANIPPSARAEALELEDFIRLVDAIADID
ncbi:MAG: ribosomal RNA small subunit methyltransferase A [Clostridiales bacterium]|nr:ribosomal RNA small subunit methyltransferase A [Clostridiales bacterium]